MSQLGNAGLPPNSGDNLRQGEEFMTKPCFAGTASTIVLGLMLAACGGAGGGIASTPTPSPVPAPAPAPAPGPTYKTLAQLTGDHTYQTAGITTSFGPPPPFALGLLNSNSLDFANGINIVFNAADNTYTITDAQGSHITFTSAEIIATDPATNAVRYRINFNTGPLSQADFTRFVPRVDGVPLSYTLMGIWLPGYSQTYDLIVGGIPTQAGDLPKSGSANYKAAVVFGYALTNGPDPISQPVISYNLVDGGSTATFLANFSADTVQTTIGLIGKDSMGSIKDFGTLTGDGTISSTDPTFSGTLAQAGDSGAFSGTLLGPQAAEMGYGWYFDSPDFTAVGLVAGKKN